MSENSLHDCVKPRGGEGWVKGPFTQCVKKTSVLVADGFPKRLLDYSGFSSYSLSTSVYNFNLETVKRELQNSLRI